MGEKKRQGKQGKCLESKDTQEKDEERQQETILVP